MSKQHHHPDHNQHGEHHGPKKIHHQWWFWVGIVLMLAAMAMYVGSIDEWLQPGGKVGEQVPAAAE
jgi:hypothetical protein